MTTTINAVNVEAVTQDGTVIIYLSSSLCSPCHGFAAAFEAVASRNPQITFAVADVEEEPTLATRFQVVATPTVVVMHDGVVLLSRMGALTERTLEGLVAEVSRLVAEPGARRRIAALQRPHQRREPGDPHRQRWVER